MRKLLLVIVLLAGCQNVPLLPGITPHKIDIQQGNYVTQAMLDKVRPGMSRSQVRFALGTPLVVDPFHADRWDYVYLYERAGRPFAKRRIVIVFQDDKVTRVEGDIVPRPRDPAEVTGAAEKPAGAPAAKPAAAGPDVVAKPAAEPPGVVGKPAP